MTRMVARCEGAAPDAAPDAPPAWILDLVAIWQARLGVADYRVSVRVADLADDDDRRVLGEATANSRYLAGAITLARTLDPADPEHRHAVAHEVGHILLGELAQVANHLISRLHPAEMSLAHDMWADAQEHTIERLTRALEAILPAPDAG
jgi:hypothetical protein